MLTLFITADHAERVREFCSRQPDRPLTAENLHEYYRDSLTLSNAQKIIGSLNKLGVIANGGSLTELGESWIRPSSMAEASASILDNFFPSEMNELFDENSKTSEIANWLTEHACIGTAVASKNATVYRFLRKEASSAPSLGSIDHVADAKPVIKEAPAMVAKQAQSTKDGKPANCIRVPLSVTPDKLQTIIELAAQNGLDIVLY